MANLYHNDRLIVAYASMNMSTKDWSAGAEITWKTVMASALVTPSAVFADRFKSSDDAERFVINLAKAWIDSDS